ncbi:hypothetical protein F4820DRAFT_442272 [Hypoxylon rubiginosum]|uniref:Uncharacterized protein n=1 Tax=Hypoxylon rubiginosum TaxID=110542 RepID=A0ACB9YHC2_9PEZI|nr:hypothetical protein F4820DRAFT_442272 [Hypoxylon rubiginosum]
MACSIPQPLRLESLLIANRPDIEMGWRYQVPHLLFLGLEVMVLDMLGYGQTSAPESLSEHTMKKWPRMSL